MKESTKKLEWDNELSHFNRVCINGRIEPLDSMSELAKEQLLEAIAPLPRLKNKTKIQKERVSYKSKIKRAVKTLSAQGHHEAAEVFQRVLDNAPTKTSLHEYIYLAEKLDMPRKKQRITLLRGFASTHQKLANQQPENNIWVQEGLLKIPHQWEVGTDKVSLDNYIVYIHKFLSEHFPDFKIKAIVGHDDERLAHENTGAHIHYFMDGQNSKTGEFNLHKIQMQKINEYIKTKNPSDALPLESGQKLNRKHAQIYGEYFQLMLYEHVNKHLLHPKGIDATFSTESEKRSERRKEMDSQAKLPKAQRKNNYHNRTIKKKREMVRQLETQAAYLAHTVAAEQAKHDAVIASMTTAQHEQVLLKQNNQELKQLNATLSDQLAELNERIIGVITQVVKNIFFVTVAREKGDRYAERNFMDKVVESISSIMPIPLRKQIESLKDDLLSKTLPTPNKRSKERDMER
ncbi:hypothetical protein [Vibrio gallicus]|uniref:hypothetical protein n=1 Tax=Vibrio gallicus TaxID=190897 RepID=UPI0021C2E42B|nr:hypothetical protein [Vibrio gallicus]